jgi:hypothetical protein
MTESTSSAEQIERELSHLPEPSSELVEDAPATSSGGERGDGANGDKEGARKRPWPVTALALFLLLQAAGLVGLAAFKLILPDPESGDLTADFGNILGILYMLLAWLALFSAAGFFRLWLNSWLMAMFLQGLCLIIALLLYFQSRPDYVYGIMIYAVFMVVYLNHYEVRDVFHTRKLLMADPEEWLS